MITSRIFRLLPILFVAAACSPIQTTSSAPPVSTQPGELLVSQAYGYVPLADFKPRRGAIPVAVYSIPDLTGMNKKGETYAEFSKAVSQGADALVVAALKTVGHGKWFDVLERRFSDDLLAERRIAMGQINEERQRAHVQRERARVALEQQNAEADIRQAQARLEQDYSNPNLQGQLPPREQAIAGLQRYRQQRLAEVKPETPYSAFDSGKTIPDLKVARYLVTGAIVAYDRDVESSGAGLRFLNTSIRKEMRKDTMTVNLRLVNVATGEITVSETVSQTVVSILSGGDFSNYVTVNKILEAEAGLATNEPGSVALDAALRLALSRLIQKQNKIGW